MRVNVDVSGDLARAVGAELDGIETRMTRAMDSAIEGLKSDFRGAIRAAGLGNLAQAIGSVSYPKVALSGGKASLHPAGEVYVRGSNPDARAKWSGVVESFMTGATIKSRDGDWLAIPTAAVPLVGSRNIRRKMTPDEARERFGPLRAVAARGKGGRSFVLLFASTVQGKSGGIRRATERRQAQGRAVNEVLLYVLVPQVVRGPRLKSGDAILNEWRAKLPALIETALGAAGK